MSHNLIAPILHACSSKGNLWIFLLCRPYDLSLALKIWYSVWYGEYCICMNVYCFSVGECQVYVLHVYVVAYDVCI